MSDLMYNEVPGYKKGDWKNYAVHDEKNVKGFFGEYRWLSNFHEQTISLHGKLYRSAENAYQAQKVVPHLKRSYQHCTPMESKKLNREHIKDNINMMFSREVWDKIKYEVMIEVILSKFGIEGYDLRQMLLATTDKYLEETNAWRDTFWGVDSKTGEGENNLGKILMKVREFWT